MRQIGDATPAQHEAQSGRSLSGTGAAAAEHKHRAAQVQECSVALLQRHRMVHSMTTGDP